MIYQIARSIRMSSNNNKQKLPSDLIKKIPRLSTTTKSHKYSLASKLGSTAPDISESALRSEFRKMEKAREKTQRRSLQTCAEMVPASAGSDRIKTCFGAHVIDSGRGLYARCGGGGQSRLRTSGNCLIWAAACICCAAGIHTYTPQLPPRAALSRAPIIMI